MRKDALNFRRKPLKEFISSGKAVLLVKGLEIHNIEIDNYITVSSDALFTAMNPVQNAVNIQKSGKFVDIVLSFNFIEIQTIQMNTSRLSH